MVFNKMDLADLKHMKLIKEYFENEGSAKVFFSDCKKQVDFIIKKQVIPAIIEIIDSGPRYNRQHADDFHLLIIGVPNVGKSSLINAIRRTHIGRGKATKVGPEAGVTRSLLERIKVCEHPPIYVLDSPGILEPKIPDVETGMKLAACANLKDHLVGEIMIADYILYWLNQHNKFTYTDFFNLPQPTDNILEVLSHIAAENNLIQRRKAITQGGSSLQPNFNLAAKKMIAAFRNGQLGRVNLDEQFTNQLHQKSNTSSNRNLAS